MGDKTDLSSWTYFLTVCAESDIYILKSLGGTLDRLPDVSGYLEVSLPKADMYAVALLPPHAAIPMAIVMATDENLSPEARKAGLTVLLNLVDRVEIPEEKVFEVAQAMANVSRELRGRKNSGQVEADLAEMLTAGVERLMDRVKCNCVGGHNAFVCASTAHLCREPMLPGDQHIICGLPRNHDFGTLNGSKHGPANPNHK